MTTVITPVGTSLFTNGGRVNTTISDTFEDIKDLQASEWSRYATHISILKTESISFIASADASAELQSTKIIQGKLDTDITVHLLASDTIASRLAAEILRDQINKSGLIPNVEAVFNASPSAGSMTDVISNLQVVDSTDFSRDGMPNLFHRINYIKDWEAGGSQNLAINITGGYSATIPYLTIFGQLENVPLYYNFEDTEELIEIPQAPLAINWDLIKRHFNVLARIDKGIEASDWNSFKTTYHQAVTELEAFIWWDKDAGACLSPIGVIFWEQYLQNHFAVDLADSISRDPTVDNAIQDLYRRLNLVLRPDHLNPPDCYEGIRHLGPNDDLNHTGQVSGAEIFIFKSTDTDQIRFLYTVEVNGRAITRIKIYAQRGHMETQQYDDWKEWISCNHSEINFETHIFDINP